MSSQYADIDVSGKRQLPIMKSHALTILMEYHSEDELRALARRLRVFRLYREHPQHSDGSERLVVAFPYASDAALLATLAALGLSARQHASAPAQPVPGKSYTLKAMREFKALIADTHYLEQIGAAQIAGQPVNVWCDAGVLCVSLVLKAFAITAQDLAAAETLEAFFAQRGLQHKEPPIASERCLCPTYHADYFD